MASSRFGDLRLYRRLADQARSSWPSILGLFLLSLLAAISVPFLQLTDEFFRITLDYIDIVVGEFSPLRTNPTLHLGPFALQNV